MTDPDQSPAKAGRPDLRAQTREQVLSSIGGWSGTVVAAVPTVVFVAVNAITGLRIALIAALASAVAVAGYRVVRHQPVQQALSGLFGVVIAALIAGRTGHARNYFLLGIITSFGYAAVFAVSIVIRRPLVGVLWEFLDPTPLPEGQSWRRTTPLRRAYDIATGAALVVFLARGLVQEHLFADNSTGWLAVARLAMGYPLYVLVVALAVWVVRRARHQLPPLPDGQDAPERPAGQLRADGTSGGVVADGLADGGLGLGKRDEQ